MVFTKYKRIGFGIVFVMRSLTYRLKNHNIIEINWIKGRTLESHSNSEISEILTRNISDSLKIKGRTLKTLIVPNEKGAEAPNSINGASDGIRLEPNCVEFLHLCLHDKETIEQVKQFLNNTIDKVS